jgi:putative membrane protein
LLLLLCAAAQLYFAYLEMFRWEDNVGPKIGRLSDDCAKATAHIGLNMGLYNALVAAGLLWSLFRASAFASPLPLYLSLFMAVAGIFGGITVHPKIYAQGGLGLAAAVALFLSR